MLSRRKLNAFQDQEQGKDVLSLLFTSIMLEALASAIRQEKAIKCFQIEKEELKLLYSQMT